MAQSTSNIVTQPGLVPLGTSGSTQALSPTQGGGIGGILSGIGNSIGSGKGQFYTPSAPTVTGFTGGANGSIIPTIAPSSPGIVPVPTPTTPNSTQSAYQQNLSKYGLTSIPAGYSFDATGKLTSSAGQEYTSPTGNNNGVLPSSNQTTDSGLVSSATPVSSGAGGGQAPSGYSYNSSGQLVPTNSLDSAISTLSNTAGSSSSQYQSAATDYSTTNQELQALKTAAANNQFIGAGTNMAEYAGTQGFLANNLANQENALTGELSADTTAEQAATGQQGTQQSGQGAVVGALAPVSQYGALTNPTTGTAISGGTSGSVLPQSAQTLVNTLAQQVQNGQMTQSQALSELTAYGPAGVSALTQALGPTFNTNNSNNSATTTQAGQVVQTAMTAANLSLGTLQSLYQSLPGFSTTGIPGLNSITNNIESLLGSSQLSSYKAALSDARAQLEGVLTATGSATPTDAASMASTYLPDNMTPSQLVANIATVKSLMQQKSGSFQGSGAAAPTSPSDIYSF